MWLAFATLPIYTIGYVFYVATVPVFVSISCQFSRCAQYSSQHRPTREVWSLIGLGSVMWDGKLFLPLDDYAKTQVMSNHPIQTQSQNAHPMSHMHLFLY